MALRRTALIAIVLFGLSPLLVLVLGRYPGASSLTALLDRWFALQCQRDTLRTARLFDAPLPVCTRCLGIYLGLALGALLGVAGRFWRRRSAPARRFQPSGRKLLVWTLAAAVVMLLDVASECLGLRPELRWLRFATGLGLALPVAIAVGAALGGTHCAGGRELRHSE
jgi:uncharacterized membrane protein